MHFYDKKMEVITEKKARKIPDPHEQQYLENLGKRIKMLREGHNMRYVQVAVLCKCDSGTISRIEKARIAAGSLLLFNIAIALHVPVAVLVDFRE